MRARSERISGWELAKTLDKYSERGLEYVDSLHAIMRVNHLDPADDAFLGDGPTIYLVPVGEGAK
jgi:Bax protein